MTTNRPSPLAVLLELQEHDKKLDKFDADLERVPKEIAALEKQISDLKQAAQATKADLTRAQLSKKEKEIELDSLEGVVAKHAKDLTGVKTNEAYKALLSEIEKAKEQKNLIEEAILGLMESIDALAKDQKVKEAALKDQEAQALEKIKEWHAEAERLKAAKEEARKARDVFAATVPSEPLERYEYIRKNKKGPAMVPLQTNFCSGCRMGLPQQVINDIKKSTALGLVQCERCQRILYIIDSPEKVAPKS